MNELRSRCNLIRYVGTSEVCTIQPEGEVSGRYVTGSNDPVAFITATGFSDQGCCRVSLGP